jgi:cytochrome c-type biogenesis protein CcmH/NrfG
MSRPCPNCGTACAMEARFCRLCGTPLKPAASTGAPVSPGAKTIPLSDEGRTTHGFPKEDGSASAPETARVRRAEMESILRRSAPTVSAPQKEANDEQAFPDDETTIVPVTTALAGGGSDKREGEDSASAQRPAANGAEAVAGVDGDASPGVEPSVVQRKDARPRRAWQVAGVALIVLAVGAGAAIFYYSRRTQTGDAGSSSSSAPASGTDQKRLVEERVAEAETLLAEGKVAEAISRLRSAIRLEPSNPRAHRLLAEALERTGAVNEAIGEYRIAAEKDPNNEETSLRYADALRRVGRTDEAREIYQKLSSSSSAEVSRVAKEQLASLSELSSSTEPPRDERALNRAEDGEANTTGASPPTSSSSSTRNGAASSSANGNNREAAGTGRSRNDPSASYATAMKIIEGKDIRKMNRAELIRAYELFQYAQSGPNAADANRRLRELDKELFERRKRKQ